MMILSQKSRQR